MPRTHGVEPRRIQTSGSESPGLRSVNLIPIRFPICSFQSPDRGYPWNTSSLWRPSPLHPPSRPHAISISRRVPSSGHRARGTVDHHTKINHDLLASAQYVDSTSLGIYGRAQFLPPASTRKMPRGTEQWPVRTVYIPATQPHR